MATYELELSDEQALQLAQVIGGQPGLGTSVAVALRNQIPIPFPVKIGAVVQTDQGQFLRWTYDAHSGEPWIAVNDVDTTLRTDEIGRITEVLAPGVDL